MTPTSHDPKAGQHSSARSLSSNNEAFRSAAFGYSAVQRSLRDYALILRERIWYVVIVFLSVFLASLVYTLGSTKLYTASASVEILPHDPVVMKVEEVRDSNLHGPEDLGTQVKILESAAIVQMVAESLTAEESKALMAPYDKGGGGDPMVPEEVLGLNRKIVPVRMTRILRVVYTHPDPEVAAKIANLFVEQFMKYNARWRVDEALKAVEDLKVRADQQGKKVQELGNALQAYREKENLVSLDQRKDIVTEKLKAVSTQLTQANARLADATVRWKQVEECQASGGDLASLSFIASSPIIQGLLEQVGTKKISVADLAQRYRPKYPKMQEAVESLSETQTELRRAEQDAASRIHNEYETALRDVEQSKAELANREAEALKLDRSSVDYSALQNDLEVNQQLLASILTRMRETSMSASIESYNARMVDRAGRPRNPSSPSVALNLATGAVGGLGLGLGLALFVAFIDDRVKSAYQIESVIGLPLIGIVPTTVKMDPNERGRVVQSNSDPLVSEAFLTLHSNLRLNDDFKKAKVVLLTSTTPGEGKTFISSNLALAYAGHGERTLIIDCDLRKPAVQKSFGIANTRGVIDYCTSNVDIDGLIVRDVFPNLDILPTGGRATNPTHILNNDRFVKMIAELRGRYDRIFIDSPPLAPVSDAKIIIPHVDGIIFAIRFNHVRVKAAQFCAKQLVDSSVPCFGAVLNGLDLALSDYYYAEYYDKSYREYLRPSANAVG